jgi:hypothetical protein
MAAAEAYFVGRSELLSWINSTLGLRINKVEEVGLAAVTLHTIHRCMWEAAAPAQVLLSCLQHIQHVLPAPAMAMQTANGAVACQLMDALFPGVVPMKKVRLFGL